jgi:peroxiredoxin
VPGLDDLTRTHAQFQAAGAELLVVFPVSPELSQEVVKQLELPYPIYADEHRQLFAAYETRFSSGAPLPAWVVVDADGVIRYIWRATEGGLLDHYPESAEILSELRALEPTR